MALFLTMSVFLLFNPSKAWADSDRSYSIQSVNIDANVRTDGSMEVVEQRLYNFDGDFKFAYHVIEKNPDQSTDPGRTEPYQIRVKNVCDEVQCYRFIDPTKVDFENRRANPPDTFTAFQNKNEVYIQWHYSAEDEKKTFTVNYLVDNAITLHSDIAELYWQFVGKEWDLSQRNVFVNIEMFL